MLIAISGTPGTGKTKVAKILGKRTRAKVIGTSYLVRKYGIRTQLDKKRRTKIIDAHQLASAAAKESKLRKKLIFEGHLSHFAPADITIILRCSPAELEKRLKRKGWSAAKIRENVEAEAIGVISGEARRGIEIDTTGKSAGQTTAEIKNILNIVNPLDKTDRKRGFTYSSQGNNTEISLKNYNYHRQKRYARKIDWTKEYKMYLAKKAKR